MTIINMLYFLWLLELLNYDIGFIKIELCSKKKKTLMKKRFCISANITVVEKLTTNKTQLQKYRKETRSWLQQREPSVHSNLNLYKKQCEYRRYF